MRLKRGMINTDTGILIQSETRQGHFCYTVTDYTTIYNNVQRTATGSNNNNYYNKRVFDVFSARGMGADVTFGEREISTGRCHEYFTLRR